MQEWKKIIENGMKKAKEIVPAKDLNAPIDKFHQVMTKSYLIN